MVDGLSGQRSPLLDLEERVLEASAVRAEPVAGDVEALNAIASGHAAVVLGENALDAGVIIAADLVTTDVARNPDPDLALIAALTDRIAAVLGVASGDEDAFDIRAALMTELYAIALILPAAQPTPSPVAGVEARGGITTLLRDAAGYSRSEPPDADEIERLAALGINLLISELGVTPEEFRRAAELAALEGDEDAPLEDPDQLDDDVQDAIRALEADDEDDPDEDAHDPDAVPTPRFGTPEANAAASGAPVSLIRRIIRADLRRVIKAFRRKTAADRIPHSSLDGLIAESEIRNVYLRTHPFSEVLCGREVFRGEGLPVPLEAIARADPSWREIELGLISPLTLRVGQPDILDASLRQVFEIKPAVQTLEATAQLYIRYLLPLNTLAYFRGDPTLPEGRARELARLLLRALNAATGQVGGKAPPFRPWLPGAQLFPGPEARPRVLPLPDRREMLVWMPLPGVISYQILKRRRRERQATKVRTPSKQKIVDHGASLAALLTAAALIRVASRNPDPIAALQALAELGGAERADLTLAGDNDALLALIVLVIVAGVLSGLALPAAAAAGAAVARFLAAGGVLASGLAR